MKHIFGNAIHEIMLVQQLCVLDFLANLAQFYPQCLDIISATNHPMFIGACWDYTE